MKKEMVNKVFVEAMDVLQVYVKIAFADITDYVTFGKRGSGLRKIRAAL